MTSFLYKNHSPKIICAKCKQQLECNVSLFDSQVSIIRCRACSQPNPHEIMTEFNPILKMNINDLTYPFHPLKP